MDSEKNVAKTMLMIAVDTYPCPMSPDTLVQTLLTGKLADVATLTEALESLMESGLLTLEQDGGEKKCAMTQKGKAILPELETMIPPTGLDELKRKVTLAYRALADGTRYFSRVEKADGEGADGKVYLTVGSCAGDAKPAELRLSFETEKQAQAAKRHFDAHPDRVLATVLAAVTGDVSYLPQ